MKMMKSAMSNNNSNVALLISKLIRRGVSSGICSKQGHRGGAVTSAKLGSGLGNMGMLSHMHPRAFSNFFGVRMLDGLDQKKVSVDKKTRQKLGRSLLDEGAAQGKAIDGGSRCELYISPYINYYNRICTN
jgi:hypothetical protein